MPKIKSQSFQYRSANENAQNCIEIETREIIEYFNITSNRWKSIRKARCCKFKQFWKLPILFDIIGFWWLLFVLSTMCPSHCCILPMNWNAHLEIWVRMKRHWTLSHQHFREIYSILVALSQTFSRSPICIRNDAYTYEFDANINKSPNESIRVLRQCLYS